MASEIIELDKLKTNYITLSDVAKNVTLSGKYTGARLVINNASGKRLHFLNGSIHSTHAEDALVFADELIDCEITATNFSLFFGGLTFWKSLERVKITGLKIYFPHTGIRCTGDHRNNDVLIDGCHIQCASHEGIYMGVSKHTPNTSDKLVIQKCHVSNCGWDGIQVGNWRNAWIVNNEIQNVAMAEEWGQWHAICVNPGSQAWIWGNTISATTKHYIINQATAYMENPKIK